MHISELFSVTDKVVVVTGGSRGIGRMIAEAFVVNGARVIITARKVADCDSTAAELSRSGSCRSLPADLSTAEGRQGFVDAVAASESGVDVLVNNAGATWGAPVDTFPESGFDKVLEVNLKAPFFLTQAMLGLLGTRATAENPSRVLMIGSIDGIRVPQTASYSYSASKAGVHHLARHLAHHLLDRHITVNAIAPGPFESKMMAFLLDDPTMRQAIANSVPLRRIGTPDDMAGAALYLASRAGAYLTGAVIPVDGGISTHG
jgi:NAD(P)-dependent dehydrogenase (short-subunit alcohol dehydrogenase family)